MGIREENARKGLFRTKTQTLNPRGPSLLSYSIGIALAVTYIRRGGLQLDRKQRRMTDYIQLMWRSAGVLDFEAAWRINMGQYAESGQTADDVETVDNCVSASGLRLTAIYDVQASVEPLQSLQARKVGKQMTLRGRQFDTRNDE